MKHKKCDRGYSFPNLNKLSLADRHAYTLTDNLGKHYFSRSNSFKTTPMGISYLNLLTHEI